MPCIAAARFALSFDTAGQEPAAKVAFQRGDDAETRAKQERTIVELNQQASVLQERMQRAPQSERAAIEARLLEVQRSLEEHKRALEQSLLTKERLAYLVPDMLGDEARTNEEKEKREVEQRLEGNRKARLISHFEPSYPADAREKKIEGSVVLRFTVNHEGIPQGVQVKTPLYPSLDQAAVEAVSKWRFEPAMKDGQPVSMWMEAEVNFNLNQEPLRGVAITRDGKTEFQQGQEYRVRLDSDVERRAEEELEQKKRLELARQARISMDQAIPGKGS
jgi:TonB family protein